MPNREKIKVGMVQINNSFDGQNYFPLSLGFLYSYAKKHSKNFEDFKFLTPIYKRIPIEQAAEQLLDADMIAFSTYVWNFEISKAIAKKVKQYNPSKVILFGGPHVPEPNIVLGEFDSKRGDLENFLRQHEFIDYAITGEGEIPFSHFLDNYSGIRQNSSQVPSMHHLRNNEVISSSPTKRIGDLNDVPSPYLNGYFDDLINENPDENWIALLETNRGCPFKCSFCDWGTVDKNKMADYDLEERIFREIDWFSSKKIEFVYCCDANFGIYAGEKFNNRDLKIAEKMAENKRVHGYPHRFSVQNTKNSTEASYAIQRVLVESGLDKGVLLAFQSLHKPTLEAIARGNIKLSTYHELQKRFTKEGVTTFSDIILGLPLETYESFTQGISSLIENGQHNRIQFNNLSLLPNAPMTKNNDIEKYGFKVVESDMINNHGSLGEWVDNIYEKQQLVVATNTMPEEDWVRARNFAYMTAFLHFDKVLQIPNIMLNSIYGVSYKEIVDSFIQNPLGTDTIGEVGSIFSEHSRNIQRGGPEYIHSKEWLNIWWPADEFALIKLATENKLERFYEEADMTFKHILKNKVVEGDTDVIFEAINLNRHMLKLPFQDKDLTIKTGYNLLEVYQAGLISERVPLTKGEYLYSINRAKEKWESWEDWCRKVIWWGNKKGDYIYGVSRLNSQEHR